NVIENIVLFLQILAAMLLLAGAVALAFYGTPLLLIYLSRYVSEVTLGTWVAIGGLTLGVLTLVYILLKKH
ncbi:MAG: hypothetical protein WC825_05830, partial [Gallionellaceae bacterium]